MFVIGKGSVIEDVLFGEIATEAVEGKQKDREREGEIDLLGHLLFVLSAKDRSPLKLYRSGSCSSCRR